MSKAQCPLTRENSMSKPKVIMVLSRFVSSRENGYASRCKSTEAPFSSWVENVVHENFRRLAKCVEGRGRKRIDDWLRPMSRAQWPKSI